MKNFLITMFIIVLVFGLTMTSKAEDRYTYDPLTVVADTADRVLTSIIIGAAGDSVTAFKLYFSDQGNTWDARAETKMVLDILPELIEGGMLKLPLIFPIMDVVNGSTRYGIFFDDGIRVEAVGNTPHVTYKTRRSSIGN